MVLKKAFSIFTVLSLLAVVSLPWKDAQAAVYTVTTTADDGVGSLRWAINQANASAGGDTITFEIPASDPNYDVLTGICTIYPLNPLPPLTGGEISIDGYTQSGAAPATESSPAVIKIRIAGIEMRECLMGLCNGFTVASSDNTIRGMAILQFSGHGIAIAKIAAPDANRNIIQGNYLGVDVNGVSDYGNTNSGVFLGMTASFNIIGGDEPAERNVISGNEWEGVGIHGTGTQENVVSGNYIGTDASGTMAVPNTEYGVRVYGGANNNRIGGSTPGEINLISGNLVDGIQLMNTTGNLVVGNLIGTTRDGLGALGNRKTGVAISHGAKENRIGGESSFERNCISGNREFGIVIEGDGTAGNMVYGNYVGLDASGKAPLSNWIHGIVLRDGARNNIIGGPEGKRNVIGDYGNYGILVTGVDTRYNPLVNNFIGTNPDGFGDLTSGNVGICISSNSADNLVQEGIIANNTIAGVNIFDVDTIRNWITQVRIYNNGTGILIEEGANGGIQSPEITEVLLVGGSVQIRGKSIPEDFIEIYANSANDPEGEVFVGACRADAVGHFTLTTGFPPYRYLTAIARAVDKGTSEFSNVFESPYYTYYLPFGSK